MRGALPTPIRERIVLGASLAMVCALAWGFTAWHAHATNHVMDAMEGMEGPVAWEAGRTAAMFLMWLVMMVAMMLPAVFPMVDAFAAISRQRREHKAPYVATAFFVGGYLLAWSGYSALATAAHWGLERSGLIDTMMRSTSGMLAGALFLAAGLYQWTPLKRVCLSRCRSPIGFMLTEWRDGRTGAIVMGLRQGAFCVGCCAVLMSLLFAVAVMNVLWVAALTVLVMIEKLLPCERFWRHAIGASLTLAGVAWMVRTLLA